ncbi:hypothetical protein HID58_050481, partial [Brassica napus]
CLYVLCLDQMITIWVIQTEIVYADKARNGDRFSSTMGFKSIHDEVPWYLVSLFPMADATGRVYVEGIQKEKGFDLKSCAFLRELNFAREIDNGQEIKCALKVDSTLAIVGNAAKDDRENINIRDTLFVCQSDVEYNVANRWCLDSQCGWLHLSLLQYYLQLSLKKFSLNETSSQIADGFNFLFQVVNFVFTSQREFFSVNYNVSFHNNFSDLMMLVIVS